MTPTPLPYAWVTANVLNVRNGPGTSYGKISQVREGDRLTIRGRNQAGDWLKIVAAGGVSGWVAAEYVRPAISISNVPVAATPSAPAAKPAVDPQFRADRAEIAPGECTSLRWDVDGVKAVHLDGIGRLGHGELQVCPGRTQTYTLVVTQLDGQGTSHPLTIQVSGQRVYPPLSIDWQLTGVWCVSRSEYTAEFVVSAQGGDRVYTYYRDIDKIGGPLAGSLTYRLRYGACCAAVGTFTAKSGDGQEASKTFYVEHPNCSK